jgi:putative endonuclease
MQQLPKNKTEKQLIGQKGEDEAVKYLEKQGFFTLSRNYRKPWGELDIIAKKGERLYFVEVKTVTRENLNFGDNYEPEDNIHPWKIKRLSRAIETYLLEKKIDDETDWQVDSIAVYLNSRGEVSKIERLEDIF